MTDGASVELPTRILIAEDDASTQTVLRYFLESQYEIQIVKNGSMALQALSESTFDLMLLDLLMPEVDGFTVLTELRRRSVHANMPVIVISALDDGDHIVRALHLGANDYVTKPLDLEVLQARIETQLGLSRLISEQQTAIESLAMTRDVQERLCRIISHDLKSPLANFRMAHYMLREIVGDSEDGQRVIDNMELTLNATLDMVRVFIEAIEAQQLRPTYGNVNVELLVHDVVAQHELRALHKSITLLGESVEGTMWADVRLLNQALSNFVNNAIKFSQPNTTTRVWSERGDGCYRFSVQDEGPGIREDERVTLFTMFAKGSNRPTGGESSSGLGLWIVQQIVSLHAGRCGVYPADGGGSVFWLEIPIPT